MELEHLKPYKSYLFCIIKQDLLVNDLLGDIQNLLKEGVVIVGAEIAEDRDLDIGHITYRDESVPPWCSDSSIKDIANHLVLLIKKTTYLAVYSSDGSVREKIRRAIIDKEKSDSDSSFKDIKLIPQGTLNAAFIKGQAQTL